MIRLLLLSAVVAVVGGLHPADARAQGRAIQARDGDVVIVPTDATITVARTTPGHLKVVAHEQGRIVIVLLDEGQQPDGIVDSFHRFDLLQQPYLPEYTYDGTGAFEEYETLGHQRGGRGYAVVLPQGRILLRSAGAVPQSAAVPEHFAAFQFKGQGSRRIRATFDDAEREALTGVSPTARVELSVGGAPAAGSLSRPGRPDGPVRVGGNVRQPRKIKDVAPVVPAAAREAGVFGTVVVELTIDAQGRVSNARILRSIPLLDQAALDAVRQWEYEAVMIDGTPAPVIMTVTVQFSTP